MCASGSGLEASTRALDALDYARGPSCTLCLVDDAVKCDGTRMVVRSCKTEGGFDATELLWFAAREFALCVIDKWDAPDIVRLFLETGAKRSAAWAAARDARRSAAKDAARAAARDPAGSAAEDAAWTAAWLAPMAAATDSAGCLDWTAWDEARAAHAALLESLLIHAAVDHGFGGFASDAALRGLVSWPISPTKNDSC